MFTEKPEMARSTTATSKSSGARSEPGPSTSRTMLLAHYGKMGMALTVGGYLAVMLMILAIIGGTEIVTWVKAFLQR